MLIIKRTTLLPINCYYGISVLAKNETVLILIPRYTVFSVYRPTLLATIAQVLIHSQRGGYRFKATLGTRLDRRTKLFS